MEAIEEMLEEELTAEERKEIDRILENYKKGNLETIPLEKLDEYVGD